MDTDPDGVIFCVSGNNKLFKIGFNNKAFIEKQWDLNTYNIKGTIVKWIKFAKEHLYIATNEGLNIIERNALYGLSTQQRYFYNTYNGYNFIAASSPIIDKNGDILIHTKDEVIWIKPVTENDFKLKLDIYNFMINDKCINTFDLSTYNLPYSSKNISFKFRIIHYPSSKNFRYRYKINEGNWVADNQVSLQSVRAGKYKVTLEVTDIERNKIYTKEITFNIAQSFWLTYWFMLLVVLIVGLSIFLILKQRYRSLHRRQLEKTKILIQNSELHLRSLQLQMNPHFIFNALTSIQYLILSKNVRNSILYLGNLASIIRSSLELASEDYILLIDEIEFLKKYIQIEMLRFKESLQINFQNECTNKDLLIPPMLIQPLIENAIKHGITARKEGGQITIVFQQINNSMEVVIEDNGIGRKASQLNQDTDKKHFGLKVVESRLKLINEIEKTEINKLEVIDLYDKGIPTGTKIIVKLAIKKR